MAEPTKPLVSIIMSMRNNAATVGMAVRSVQLQTLQDWELIVIDDGSIDESAAIVSGFNDHRIRLIRESAAAGLATRLNQAVALSGGALIARMDADDVCFPDRLALQAARLEQDPALDLLGCGAVVFADDLSLIGEMPIRLTHAEIIAQPFRGFPLPHPSWCGRAEWFRNNPYDASLMKTQDQDLLLRSFKTSRFAALDDVLIGYRQNALNLRKMLFGRRVFMASLWDHARRSGAFLPVLGGIAGQIVKGAVDAVTTSANLNWFAQRRRLRPVRSAVAKRWADLQQQLCASERAA